MEHAFGRMAAFALGIEEEVLLVEPRTHALAHTASQFLPRLRDVPGEVKHDTYEALVETATPVVRNALEGAAVLDASRARLRGLGATFIGAGLHPTGAFGDAVHVPRPRYRAIADTMRGLLRRTPTAAMHVHVGMPDPDTALRAFNRMRAHLPLLQALSAHSPFWHGVDSGFATARAQVFRGFPRAVVPRQFAGWDEYVQVVSATVQAGELEDYSFLWWDIRPHPKLGTVEVRAMDAQARIDSVCGLAALVHALLTRCAHEPPPELPPTEAIAESSFRASRDGLRATLWWEGALRPVPEIAASTLALARPYARDLHADDALDEVERILREGNGADRMRAAHARGGMPAVLSGLVAEAAAPLFQPALSPAR